MRWFGNPQPSRQPVKSTSSARPRRRDRCSPVSPRPPANPPRGLGWGRSRPTPDHRWGVSRSCKKRTWTFLCFFWDVIKRGQPFSAEKEGSTCPARQLGSDGAPEKAPKGSATVWPGFGEESLLPGAATQTTSRCYDTWSPAASPALLSQVNKRVNPCSSTPGKPPPVSAPALVVRDAGIHPSQRVGENKTPPGPLRSDASLCLCLLAEPDGLRADTSGPLRSTQMGTRGEQQQFVVTWRQAWVNPPSQLLMGCLHGGVPLPQRCTRNISTHIE